MPILYKDLLNAVPQWISEDYIFANTTAPLPAYTAGAIINGGKAVIMDTDGKIYPFDILNPTHYDKYLGIASQGANVNDLCEVVIEGVITHSGAGWSAGVAYYISATSLLTATPPVLGLVKKVGVGVGTDSVLLNGVIEIETI